MLKIVKSSLTVPFVAEDDRFFCIFSYWFTSGLWFLTLKTLYIFNNNTTLNGLHKLAMKNIQENRNKIAK